MSTYELSMIDAPFKNSQYHFGNESLAEHSSVVNVPTKNATETKFETRSSRIF